MSIQKLLYSVPETVCSLREYNTNKQGFRSDEFDKEADIKVATIGCSFPFGWQIMDRQQTFPQMFCNHIEETTGKTVANWNLSLPGKSNRYVAYMSFMASKALNPDITLLMFTQITRRSYFGDMWEEKDDFLNFLPFWTGNPQFEDPVKAQEQKFLNRIVSPHEDHMDLFINYQAVRGINMGRMWFYGTCLGTPFLKYMNKKRFAGHFPMVDQTWDKHHPGPQSHTKMAGMFIETYETWLKEHKC